jgi:hypothetical protein
MKIRHLMFGVLISVSESRGQTDELSSPIDFQMDPIVKGRGENLVYLTTLLVILIIFLGKTGS